MNAFFMTTVVIKDDSQRKDILIKNKTLKQKPKVSRGVKRLDSCFQPHGLVANSGIVLQSQTVMVHLVWSWKKGKRKLPPRFILLFVLEHLKEIEFLNDRRLCIEEAILKDCIEYSPSAGWLAACFKR